MDLDRRLRRLEHTHSVDWRRLCVEDMTDHQLEQVIRESLASEGRPIEGELKDELLRELIQDAQD